MNSSGPFQSHHNTNASAMLLALLFPSNFLDPIIYHSPSQQRGIFFFSKPLLHPPRHPPQIPINLPGRLPQNQTDHGLPRDPDIPIPAQNMHLAIRQHHPRPGRILNRKLGLPILPRDAANRPPQMLALKRLDVFDLEAFDIELIQPQEGDGIVDVEAEAEGPEEVFAFLERVGCGWVVARGAELDGAGFGVHAHLEVEVFDQGRVDFGPGVFEGGHAVGGDGDFAVLDSSCG